MTHYRTVDIDGLKIFYREPYRRDLPKADLKLLDTGHFALEEQGDVIAAHIRRFAASLSSL
ncbi:hypothetical protein [Bradyrhizobium sp. NAS80.1]|uniref:hypothetical protein n=1 Tax=Bradyrhizobium sp. NAS80.1 TaxID=1680159 RepID=UPI000A077917